MPSLTTVVKGMIARENHKAPAWTGPLDEPIVRD